MKKHSYVPDEGTRLNPRKTTKWSGDRQHSSERIQTNDSENDSGSWKRMEANIEKMKEIFTKDLWEMKNKQAEMNSTLEGIHSRITESEWINDLEDRMVEITGTE